MKRALIVSVVCGGVLVAGCFPTGGGATDPGMGARLGEMALSPEVRDALSSRIANGIVTGGQPLPAARASFTYAGDDDSDVLLHSSLTSRDDVKITFTPSEDVPDRAALWLQKVRASEGEVVTCDVSDGSGFGGVFAAWVAETLAHMAMDAVRDYALYRPAGDKHAILEKDAGTGHYRAIRFVSRTGDHLARTRAEYRQCRP